MILSQLEAPAYRIAQKAHSLVWGLGISVDILAWSRAEFERRLPLMASLQETALFIERVPLHQLPAETAAKLKNLEINADYRLPCRNLSMIIGRENRES
jgi:hypothetical protein